MSDSNQEEMKRWMLKNYPVEAVFVDEINKCVNDIYQHLPTHPGFQEDQPKDLLFRVVKRHETGYAELMMSADAVLFIAGMAKAISNVILLEIVPNLLPETKKCVQCDTTNNRIAKYCLQCGSKFEG